MRKTTLDTPVRRAGAIAATLTAALLATAASSLAVHPIAQLARVLDGTATARLHLIAPDGSQLIEEGPVTGSLPGSAWAKVHTGAQFSGIFTIHTHGGAISGSALAKPHGLGRYQSFSGTFTATGGTGRYAHVHGQGGIYGVFDRLHESVVIQTTGTLDY
jgi:hypothetical protein